MGNVPILKGDFPFAKAAAKVSESLAMNRLHPAVVAALRELPEEAGIGLCVSGGADSVAMMVAVHAYFPELRGRLRVLHFNHRTQGATSDEVAQMVAELAEGLGVECEVGVATEALAGKREHELRAARLAFFAESGVSARVTGHQADDVAENFLIRLGRGEGLRGLSSMRPVDHDGRMVVLRPFLGVRRAEIREALEAAKMPFWDDPTNEDPGASLRAAIRHVVLPAWQGVETRDLVGAIGRSREELEKVHYQDSTSAKPREEGNEGAEVDPGRVEPEGSAVLGPGVSVVLPDGRWVAARIVAVDEALREAVFTTGEEGGEDSRAPGFPVAESPKPSLGVSATQYLSTSGSVWRVRFWEYGDAYRPLNGPGTMKLQDVFVNKKLPRRERKSLPVVVDCADKILWVPGLAPAHEARVRPGTTRAVALTYVGSRTD